MTKAPHRPAVALRRSDKLLPRRTKHRYKNLRSELTYIGTLFLVSRLVLTIVGVVAHASLETGYGKQFSWSKYPWLDIWGVWDSFWYMNIVQEGYSTASVIPGNAAQTNFPFFPMYPLLMKGLGTLMGGKYFLAGLVISNVCLLISGYLLYKLVESEQPDAAIAPQARETARRSVKFFFLFPVSFILSGLFTESLYLCLTLLCFYWAKRHRWLAVGLTGACLSATRTLGVLIILPMALEYLRSIDFKVFRIRREALYLMLIPAGLLCFCLYNYQVTGDFFYFKTNQAAWGREILNPATVLIKALVEGVKTGDAKVLLELGFSLVGLIFRRCFTKELASPTG
ncbi:MAG: hypothetical protein AAF528_13500 [Cyanobacteria bacterium P01_C01_bin.121]